MVLQAAKEVTLSKVKHKIRIFGFIVLVLRPLARLPSRWKRNVSTLAWFQT